MADDNGKRTTELRDDIAYIRERIDILCNNVLPRVLVLESQVFEIKKQRSVLCGAITNILTGVTVAVILYLCAIYK